jgi:hypothetical protein
MTTHSFTFITGLALQHDGGLFELSTKNAIMLEAEEKKPLLFCLPEIVVPKIQREDANHDHHHQQPGQQSGSRTIDVVVESISR